MRWPSVPALTRDREQGLAEFQAQNDECGVVPFGVLLAHLVTLARVATLPWPQLQALLHGRADPRRSS